MIRLHEVPVLAILFGSTLRARLLRFFFRHPSRLFELSEILDAGKGSSRQTEHELKMLMRIGLLKAKTIFISEEGGEKYFSVKKRSGRKRKVFILDHSFPLYGELHQLVNKSFPRNFSFIVEKLQSSGKIKLLITSGVFHQIHHKGTRCDLLLVGDNLKKPRVEEAIRSIEETMGEPITYALMSTQEFLYRYDIYDKFIRDILDYPHEKVINKLSI